MSLKEELDLSDPWNRLQYVYSNCKVKQYVAGHYAKYEDGKLSMCGIGWALHSAGWTDEELKPNLNCAIKTFVSTKQTSKALNEFGFSKKDLEKRYHCPLPDCTSKRGLQGILEHINEAHRIPIPNIGKLIPIIRKQEKRSFTLKDYFNSLKQDYANIVNSR